ncbi:hypothetical protein KSP40_PGU010291 [Platanthera guangdongensis]|uniref:HTH OST-type domain-containing protein n=1 Tax=Platanthera guangdongensis TaxID=2320717 RepID=A0ABR2LRX2_9ASPA
MAANRSWTGSVISWFGLGLNQSSCMLFIILLHRNPEKKKKSNLIRIREKEERRHKARSWAVAFAGDNIDRARRAVLLRRLRQGIGIPDLGLLLRRLQRSGGGKISRGVLLLRRYQGCDGLSPAASRGEKGDCGTVLAFLRRFRSVEASLFSDDIKVAAVSRQQRPGASERAAAPIGPFLATASNHGVGCDDAEQTRVTKPVSLAKLRFIPTKYVSLKLEGSQSYRRLYRHRATKSSCSPTRSTWISLCWYHYADGEPLVRLDARKCGRSCEGWLKPLSANLHSVSHRRRREHFTTLSSSMKFILPRSLIVKLSCYSFSSFNPPFLRPHPAHPAAGDEAHGSDTNKCRSFSSSLSNTHKNVKIKVWWDIENCSIPKKVNPHLVRNRVISALRSSGINIPDSIKAFGDVAQLSPAAQKVLATTGISLTHVPHSGKNSADKSIIADIFDWVSQNPPPAHIFLISGDGDFAKPMHRLRMDNYNILISCTVTASGDLLRAASVMWPWIELVTGENVVARHFNKPPDGLDGSWYGHYEGRLDDPSERADNPTPLQPEKSNKPISEPKIRRIPKAVVKGILQVLDSYPEGISLSELHTELKRNNMTIDKDFYGHKYFSQFLEAVNLLKAVPRPAVGG